MIESLAPRVGLEPTTLRLTAECSTIELSRNIKRHVPSKPHIVLHPFFLNHCRKFEFMFIHSNDQRTRSQRSLRIRFASSQCHLLRKYHVFRSSVHVCKHPFSLSRHPCCFLRAFGQALDLLVTVSCMRYRTSTSALSTSSSLRGLM